MRQRAHSEAVKVRLEATRVINSTNLGIRELELASKYIVVDQSYYSTKALRYTNLTCLR